MEALPFAHLNLRRNPFGELEPHDRVRLAIVELQDVLDHLRRPRAAVQILGEKGFGKTTHLLAIAGEFPRCDYVHLPEGERRAIPEHGEPLLIDEAQRMTLGQRWHALRSGRRLVLGTHSDFARALQRAGRPVLSIAANRLTDASQLFRILNARIEGARRSPGPLPSITLATASQLLTQFGTDVRSIEHSLYQVFQQLRNLRNV